MKAKKITFLLVGLLMPVLVFVFLKFFGKNQFDVPLLYANGVERIPAGCPYAYSKPYTIPDSAAAKLNLPDTPLAVINFGNESSKLKEVMGHFQPTEIRVVGADERIEELSHVKKCILLMEDPASIVLVDRERNIRGHYDGANRDDLDRLQAEITIILKKY